MREGENERGAAAVAAASAVAAGCMPLPRADGIIVIRAVRKNVK